eukprot:1384099-Rhodomonas_salina.1
MHACAHTRGDAVGRGRGGTVRGPLAAPAAPHPLSLTPRSHPSNATPDGSNAHADKAGRGKA